jgi:hypothetical protein
MIKQNVIKQNAITQEASSDQANFLSVGLGFGKPFLCPFSKRIITVIHDDREGIDLSHARVSIRRENTIKGFIVKEGDIIPISENEEFLVADITEFKIHLLYRII